ncbi:MAG: hypothetical protein LBJ67_04350 [Planctomycetaceae bacterium]|jgi:hypothetical protein|nr:hypothetical protein [Planctomycetaceae bacterium]
MHDSLANQEVYSQPSDQKEGCGFPTMRAVAVIALATGMVYWNMRFIPAKGLMSCPCFAKYLADFPITV